MDPTGRADDPGVDPQLVRSPFLARFAEAVDSRRGHDTNSTKVWRETTDDR